MDHATILADLSLANEELAANRSTIEHDDLTDPSLANEELAANRSARAMRRSTFRKSSKRGIGRKPQR